MAPSDSITVSLSLFLFLFALLMSFALHFFFESVQFLCFDLFNMFLFVFSFVYIVFH